MFAPDTGRFPQLKGQAAELRGLGKPLRHIWEKKMDYGNRQHRLVRMGLAASVTLEEIIDRNVGKPCLVGGEKELFVKTCWEFAGCINGLGGVLPHQRDVAVSLHYETALPNPLRIGVR